MYNIIWFDDEHEDLSGTKAKAARFNLKLEGFTSLEAGMKELKDNAAKYDAVLLDAKFFEQEGDSAGTEDTSAAIQAKHAIGSLEKHFDIFVLTGQSEDDIDKTFHKVFPGRIYQKGIAEDDDRIFNDLRTAAEDQPDAHIRTKYAQTLSVCTADYLGDITYPEVVKLLKALEKDELAAEHLNQIRNVVERAMVALQEYEFMPYEIKALNAQSRFLGGLDSEASPKSKRPSFLLHNDNLPEDYHKNLIRALVDTVQRGSHATKLDTFIKTTGTPYWPKATMYQLMAFIEWFKIYIDSEPRMNKWRSSDTRRR
jgi:hypothetical protein